MRPEDAPAETMNVARPPDPLASVDVSTGIAAALPCTRSQLVLAAALVAANAIFSGRGGTGFELAFIPIFSCSCCIFHRCFATAASAAACVGALEAGCICCCCCTCCCTCLWKFDKPVRSIVTPGSGNCLLEGGGCAGGLAAGLVAGLRFATATRTLVAAAAAACSLAMTLKASQ